MRSVDCQYQTQGGMVDTASLRLLAESAAEHGSETLRFTSDQKIIIHGMMESRALHLKSQLGAQIGDACDDLQNIVTTAPVAGIGVGRPWLRKSSFTDVLEKFDYSPNSQVVIADPTQSYLPAVYGQINVLADACEDQWRICATNAEGETCAATGMLRGALLAEAVNRIEVFKSDPERSNFNSIELTDLLSDLLRSAKKEVMPIPVRFRNPPESISLPQPQAGWDAGFVQDLCLFALQQEVTSLGLTPWRSLTLSRLNDTQMGIFEELCFQRRITLEKNSWRHWLLVESGCESVADSIVNMLHRVSPVNPGYALAVQNSAHSADTPILVCPDQGNNSRFSLRKRFTLWCRPKGGARDAKMHPHASGLLLEHVHLAILNLLDSWTGTQAPAPVVYALPTPQYCESYRCTECASEYNAQYGDTLGGVPAETSFDNLPLTWTCPVCEAPKIAYRPLPI